MFPGFVNAFKDNDKNVHLYFYPGLDERNKPIYRTLDLSNCEFEYKYTKNDDGSWEYVFDSSTLEKPITEIRCKLITSKSGHVVEEILTI